MGGKAGKTGDLLARCMTEFGQHSDEGMGADWADAFDGAQALFLSFDRCIGLHKVSYLLLDLIDLGVDKADFSVEEVSNMVAIGGLAAVGGHCTLIHERLAMLDKGLKFFSFWVRRRPILKGVEAILAVEG